MYKCCFRWTNGLGSLLMTSQYAICYVSTFRSSRTLGQLGHFHAYILSAATHWDWLKESRKLAGERRLFQWLKEKMSIFTRMHVLNIITTFLNELMYRHTRAWLPQAMNLHSSYLYMIHQILCFACSLQSLHTKLKRTLFKSCFQTKHILSH